MIAEGFWELEVGEDETRIESFDGFRRRVLKKIMEQ